MAIGEASEKHHELESLSGSVKNYRVWGFAFHRAWITSYLMLFNVSASALSRDALGIDNYTFSLVILMAVLLCGAIFSENFRKWLPKNEAILMGGLLVFLGTACLFGVRYVPSLAAGFAIVSGVTTGIGSGFLILQWGQVYGNQPERNSQVYTAMAFALGVVFYSVLLFIPVIPRILVGCCFPIISAFMLYKIRQEGKPEVRKNEEPLEMTESLIRIAITAAVICFVGSLVSGIAQMNRTKTGSHFFAFLSVPKASAIFMALSVVVTSFIILVCIFRLKESKLGVIYRWVLLFIAGGAGLLFVTTIDLGWPFILGMMGRECFELIFWVTLANMSYRYSMNPVRVFSIGRFGWACGPLLSEIALSNVVWRFEPDSGAIAAIVIICLILVLITYLFILPERNIERITEIESVEVKKQKVASFQERSKRLVERYGLSPREAEVLDYLLKGRDTVFIQNQLFISAGTVSTHRQRIYSKCGVHSRQELIDLFENIDIQDLFTEE